MSVNIWLEDVPDAILEAVKARLMRRRKELEEDKEQQKRKPSEPGPQIKEFGGDSDEWRRPEPGVVGRAVMPVAHGSSTDITEVEDKGVAQVLNSDALESVSFVDIPSATTWKIWSGNQKQFLAHEETLGFSLGPAPNIDYETTTSTDAVGGFSRTITTVKWLSTVGTHNQKINRLTILIPCGKGNCITIKLFRYYSITTSLDYKSLYYIDYPPFPPNSGVSGFVGVQTAYGEFPAGTSPQYDPPLVTFGFTTDNFTVVGEHFNAITKAYLCSRTLVKEIQVKAPLKSLLDNINPPEKTADELLVTFPDQDSILSDGFYGRSRPEDDPYKSRTWSPSVFQWLLDYANNNSIDLPFDSGMIKAFPGSKPPLLTDNKGFYGYSADDKSLYYANWTGDKNNVNVQDFSKYKSVGRRTLKIPKTQDPLPTSSTVHAVWDWDDPVYCRMMCLELGFEPADLRP